MRPVAWRKRCYAAASCVDQSDTVGRAVTVTGPLQFQHVGSTAASRPSTSHASQNQCETTCTFTGSSFTSWRATRELPEDPPLPLPVALGHGRSIGRDDRQPDPAFPQLRMGASG